MENPEGVGLITAVALSSGFLLLSNLLSTTFHHLKRARRRPPSSLISDSPCASSASLALISDHARFSLALDEAPSPPFLHASGSGLDGDPNCNNIVSTGSAGTLTVAIKQGMPSTTEPPADRLSIHPDEAGHRTKEYRARETTADGLHLSLVESQMVDRSPGRLMRKFKTGATAGAVVPAVLRQHSSSCSPPSLTNKRDAVAARYKHKSTEPCSLAKKYLANNRVMSLRLRCLAVNEEQYTYVGRYRSGLTSKSVDALLPHCLTRLQLGLPDDPSSTTADEKLMRTSKKVRFSSSNLEGNPDQQHKEGLLRVYRCHNRELKIQVLSEEMGTTSCQYDAHQRQLQEHS